MGARHYALAVTDRLELLDSLRTLGTARLLQIIQIVGAPEGEAETALRAGADECVDGNASEMLLQARFSSARRMADRAATPARHRGSGAGLHLKELFATPCRRT